MHDDLTNEEIEILFRAQRHPDGKLGVVDSDLSRLCARELIAVSPMGILILPAGTAELKRRQLLQR